MVIDMYSNSPAAKAGIHEASQQVRIGFRTFFVGGDVILAIGGKPVNTVPELQTEIYRYKPGDKMTVTVLRNNRKVDLPITLEEAPRQ
jgi:S1-C subfamily serine protease